MKKNILILLLVFTMAIILFLLNINNVYAMNCMDYTPWADANKGSTGSDGGDGGGGGASCPGEGRFVYCNISDAGVDEYIKLEENLYDENGELIGSALQIQDKYVLISGRFVGIDAYEDYKKTFYVTINPVCRYGHIEPHTIHHYVSCWGEDEVRVDCGWDETIYVLECDACSVSVSECRGQANARLEQLANSVDLSESYIGKRQDVNDIEKGVVVNEDKALIDVPKRNENDSRYKNDSFIDRGHSEPANQNSSLVWQTVQKRYTYNLSAAWIDPRTGTVKYESECGYDRNHPDYNECYNKDEDENYLRVYDEDKTIIRKTGEEIRLGWYFVPLNAKSTDLLRYYLKPNMNSEVISENMCIALIDKYKDKNVYGEHWSSFIAFKSGEPMYPTIKTYADAIAKVKHDHGCRMGLYTRFKIQQEYYHENNNSLNGYNFYYRPIDHTKPFPNGMIENDYWHKVYDENNNLTKVYYQNGKIDRSNSQKLSESYSKVTYRTNNDYNTTTIRNYNAAKSKEKEITEEGYETVNRIYSSWSEMKSNGKSGFIDKGNGVSRAGCNSFYMLGCGPSNIDWAQCKVTECGN